MEANQAPIHTLMDKEDVVYMYNGILLRHKKEWNLAICDNVGGTRGYKWSKSGRETQILYDFTYMWNLKNKTEFPGGPWLGLCTFTAKGVGSVSGRGTKIPQAAQHGQKNFFLII